MFFPAECNEFSRRWAATIGGERSTVFSGVSAWLPLVALLSTAQGDAAAELAEATGVSRDAAAQVVRESAGALDGVAGVSAAMGVWARAGIDLKPATSALGIQVGTLESQEQLNAWATEKTDGLVTKLASDIDDSTELVLASAVVARSDWVKPHDGRVATFRGTEAPGVSFTPDLADVAMIDDKVSRVISRTKAGFAVHLLSGEAAMAPATVLSAGIEAVTSPERAKLIPLQDGFTVGAARVERAQSVSVDPSATVEMPVFSLNDKHDLLKRADLCGLGAARRMGTLHFPGLSDTLLAVQAAGQNVCTTYSQEGFTAGAVSDIAMMMGGCPHLQEAYTISLRLDQPFGFLVVAPSGLIIFSGWLADLGDA